jgi:hypothetical protein
LIDLEAVVRDHPKLIADILAASSGPLGEILVAQKLRGLDCQVEALNNNTKQRDLQVYPPNGEPFFVETKTVRMPRRTRAGGAPSVTWFVNNRPDPEQSRFWILVTTIREPTSLPRDEDVIFYVLTVEEAAKAWQRSPSSPSIGDITTARLRKYCPDCEGAFDKLGL